MTISEEWEDAKKKAIQDMIIYGTGAILVSEDKIEYISPGDIYVQSKEDES